MLAPIEKVAMLALVYRTMNNERYGGPESLHDDLNSYREGLSLVGAIGSQALHTTDWALVEALYQADIREQLSPVDLAGELARDDPWRTEALLHAWPRDPREQLAQQTWARPYFDRWELVQAALRGLEPLAWTHERVEDVALTAVAQASGRTYSDAWDEWRGDD